MKRLYEALMLLAGPQEEGLGNLSAALDSLIDLVEGNPLPPKLVYHASPFARQILRMGFVIKPSRQTFGGHGKYISATTKDNAIKYAQGLVYTMKVLQGKLDWVGFKAEVERLYGCADWNSVLFNIFYNDIVRDEQDYTELKATIGGFYEKELVRMSKMAEQGVDWRGAKITPERELRRRWDMIRTLHTMGKCSEDYPFFFGIDIPKHLLVLDPSDVGVVEIEVVGVLKTTKRDWGYLDTGQRKREGRVNVTYNRSENEWRFYDAKDIRPIRVLDVEEQ